MAILHAPSKLILVSSDMLLDGVHFDTTAHDSGEIGRKAIACALSDCAAMAVRPLAATVAVALPAKARAEASVSDSFDAKMLFRGMFTVAREYGLAIAGGDTTRWPHPLAIDVAVTAAPFEGIDPVTRSGASPGDTLYVTGSLGGSECGRHLRFIPRVREAQALAAALGPRLHAMIDISDGLSLDLWRMCGASGVGAILDEGDLQAVISEDARRLAAESQPGQPSALDRALSDGEDFELLLSAVGEPHVPDVRLHRVGTVTDSLLQIRLADGSVEALEPRGFVH